MLAPPTPSASGPKAGLRRLAAAFLGDLAGASAVMFALALPVLVGAVGLATEATYWKLQQRSLQRVADVAALVAAKGGPSFVAEAKALAAMQGFTDGMGGVTVAVVNSNSAPGCTS